MDIGPLNHELHAENPTQMILQSFEGPGGILQLAFSCGGGPREDQALLVTFSEAIIFHLPAVLYHPAFFRKATVDECAALIPERSYDPDEISERPGAFKVVILENEESQAYGYYVAAASVSFEWVKAAACRYIW